MTTRIDGREGRTHLLNDGRDREAARKLDKRLQLALDDHLIEVCDALRGARRHRRRRRRCMGGWRRDGRRLRVRIGICRCRYSGRALRGRREVGRRERREVLEPRGRRLEPVAVRPSMSDECAARAVRGRTHLLMIVASECSPPDDMGVCANDCVVKAGEG